MSCLQTKKMTVYKLAQHFRPEFGLKRFTKFDRTRLEPGPNPASSSTRLRLQLWCNTITFRNFV